MAATTNIKLLSNPSVGAFAFQVDYSITGFSYSKEYNKTFVSGIPITSDQVQIGVSLSATQLNLFNNLVANHVDSNTSFLNLIDSIEIIYSPVGDYEVTILIEHPDVEILPTLIDDVITEPVVGLLPLDIKDLSIEIIDTYENELPIIVEFTEASSPKIVWNSGDDIYNSLMTSILTFNMLVPGSDDAHFIHLLTGDEKRYLVKLTAINADEETQLVWQGFLLPDIYKEPYKNGGFFVDFTAVDMLASLKGKYFKPWYHANVFTVTEILAMILKETGLIQNMLIAPSLFPVDEIWEKLNCNLSIFKNSDKYDNLYKILETILVANALTITSFRGYWFIDGFTRKKDNAITYFQFDTNGKRIEDLVLNKVIKTSMLSRDLPVISSKTPFRKSIVNVNLKGEKDLFSADVCGIKEIFKTKYWNGGKGLYPPITRSEADMMLDKYFRDWIVNCGSNVVYRKDKSVQNFYYRIAGIIPSEPTALANYFECIEKPYLKAGQNYTLELEFYSVVFSTDTDEEFKERLDNGEFDLMFPFQLFLNNNEVLSNRPSFVLDEQIRYEATGTRYLLDSFLITFKLKKDLNFDVDGEVKFRILTPIIDNEELNILPNLLDNGIRLLSLKLEDDYQKTEGVTAVRDINYTQEKDYNIDIVCSCDSSINSSFGFGFANNTEYIFPINRTVSNSELVGHHYFKPEVDAEMLLETWQIPFVTFLILAAYGYGKNVFLEKATGEQIPFFNLYFRHYTETGDVYRMGYLKEFDTRCIVPKNYEAFDSLDPTDVLKCMVLYYNIENKLNRTDWKLHNSDVIKSFGKTLASVFHNTIPEQIFVLEATALDLIFPTDLYSFFYADEDRNFIPTTLTLDLFNGKTQFISTENKYQEITEVSYE